MGELDTVWQWMRFLNFWILFTAFIVMLYKGTYKLFADRESFNSERAMNLVWTVVSIYSISEVLFLDVEGGPRVILMTMIASLQLYVAVVKFKHVSKDDS